MLRGHEIKSNASWRKANKPHAQRATSGSFSSINAAKPGPYVAAEADWNVISQFGSQTYHGNAKNIAHSRAETKKKKKESVRRQRHPPTCPPRFVQNIPFVPRASTQCDNFFFPHPPLLLAVSLVGVLESRRVRGGSLIRIFSVTSDLCSLAAFPASSFRLRGAFEGRPSPSGS